MALVIAVGLEWAVYGIWGMEEKKGGLGQGGAVRGLLEVMGALPMSLTKLGTNAINNVTITVISGSVTVWATIVRALRAAPMAACF